MIAPQAGSQPLPYGLPGKGGSVGSGVLQGQPHEQSNLIVRIWP